MTIQPTGKITDRKHENFFAIPSQLSDGKLLIHCEDGVGQSGLFLCAMKLLEKKQLTNNYDVAWSILSTKETDQRFLSDSQQLKFLFQLIGHMQVTK